MRGHRIDLHRFLWRARESERVRRKGREGEYILIKIMLECPVRSGSITEMQSPDGNKTHSYLFAVDCES